MGSNRVKHLRDFYGTLQLLEERLGGRRTLSTCDGRMPWPNRGAYFFFEPGEVRSDSGDGLRLVRVGTHALTKHSRTTLWQRLSQHRGSRTTGGGNHRGSIFRLFVGTALMHKHPDMRCESWGRDSSAGSEIRRGEQRLERLVSQYIGAMSVLWVPIDDEPGPDSLRGKLERNAIALLSNLGEPTHDPPSKGWLGHHCSRERVRTSGLWNFNHVEEAYEPDFLRVFKRLTKEAQSC